MVTNHAKEATSHAKEVISHEATTNPDNKGIVRATTIIPKAAISLVRAISPDSRATVPATRATWKAVINPVSNKLIVHDTRPIQKVATNRDRVTSHVREVTSPDKVATGSPARVAIRTEAVTDSSEVATDSNEVVTDSVRNVVDTTARPTTPMRNTA